MTCIVGYFDKETETSWIGGDSYGSNNVAGLTYNNRKVFSTNIEGLIIGSSSSYRHIDLLRYSEDIFPKHENEPLDRKYIVKNVIPQVKKIFQDEIVVEDDTQRGCNFIIGSNKGIYEVQTDYSVLEPSEGFCAVGSGSQVAMGSMFATLKTHPEWAPVEHIRMALLSAEWYNPGVRRPFWVVSTKYDKPIEIKRVYKDERYE